MVKMNDGLEYKKVNIDGNRVPYGGIQVPLFKPVQSLYGIGQ